MCGPPTEQAPLSPAARAALASRGARLSVARREVVVAAGARTPAFYTVLSGRLKMCRATPHGRNLVLALVGAGEAVAITAALTGEPATASWEALVDSELLAVQRDDFLALLREQPALSGELLAWLARPLAECRNCLVETSCSRVESRFAALFLRLAADAGEPAAAGQSIALPLSRQELADLTGTTLETAIRVMSRWGRDGIVATRRGGFVVLDSARLEAISWA